MIEIIRDTFSHWALYVGNGYVLHLTTDGDSSTAVTSAIGTRIGLSATGNAIVRKQRLSEVALHGKWLVDNYLDEMCKPKSQDVILDEAELLVDQEIPYDLLTNNCEHLITNLRYGKPESRQVQKYQDGVILLLGCWVLFSF
ncbi:phospholipase A and acyltransferase 3-like [Clupea harengus]|uniref:Phospholipase A and acyltransferase 3-like n=1 Tax=Clupea harengus TaxID=7950 RepID=A0A8M1KG37_CLUHA|nr:phospholipase A and acyltransferase 3-like [Clupea harengus]